MIGEVGDFFSLIRYIYNSLPNAVQMLIFASVGLFLLLGLIQFFKG